MTAPPADAAGSQAAHASRVPPPIVAPVTIDGVTYRQMSGSAESDAGQVGGLLGAYDAGGKRLWWLKVYDNKRDEAVEGDVQDVYFASMERRSDGTLLIVDENGVRYSVDVKARTATRIMATAPGSGREGMLPPPQ